MSNTLQQATANVSVNFTDGPTVTGNNVSGASGLLIGPGQDATAEVSAMTADGENLRFTGCEILSYALASRSGPVFGSSYAG